MIVHLSEQRNCFVGTVDGAAECARVDIGAIDCISMFLFLFWKCFLFLMFLFFFLFLSQAKWVVLCAS
jgi:hypothetical protein